MVSCSLTGIQLPCPGSGALAGVFLYPTEMNVADGAQVKLQIMTNAYECDDTGYVPTEYCIDWGDGSQTPGTFPSGYNIPKNVELTHVYRYRNSQYDSTSYNPAVTIETACGGIRTVNTADDGRSCKIYVWQPGTNPIPSPNMSTYRLHPDFNFASCAGIFPDCSGTETDKTCVDGFYRKCVEGFWARDLNSPCGGGGGAWVCNGETKCVGGELFNHCSMNNTWQWMGTGQSCGTTQPPGGGCVEGTPKCVGGSGQRCVGGVWVNDGSIDCTGGIVVTPPIAGFDILATIMDFYENNKLVSIGAIALLGGVVLFGGGGHRD